MGLDRVSKLLAPECNAPSVDEWDAARVVEFGIVSSSGAKSSADQNSLAIAVSEMHWLSLVCFIEQLDPTDLLLRQDLAPRVAVELAQLRAFNSLAAYAVCLERLCIDKDRCEGDEKGNPMAQEAAHASH